MSHWTNSRRRPFWGRSARNTRSVWMTLEGGGQGAAVGGVVAGQGQGQVVAQAHIGQLALRAGGQGGGELVAPLEHLKDQVQVFAALGLVQVLQVLQQGGGDPLKAGGAVHLQDLALDVVPQGLFGGQKVPHPFQR